MISLVIFWAGVSLVVYTYALFPVLILVRGRLLERPFVTSNHTPSVSVVVAAYNEEAHIGKRIENLLGQDYPLDRVQILIASDGSSDRTEAIAPKRSSAVTRIARWGALSTIFTANSYQVSKETCTLLKINDFRVLVPILHDT